MKISTGFLETILALAMAVALLSAGAVISDALSTKTISALGAKEVKITVDVKSEGKAQVSKGDRVARVMDIPNTEGRLSSMTYINKDKNKAYMKIYSSISISDVSSLWNDLNVLNGMDIKDIDLFISSPGGDAFSGMAITDQLKRAQAKGFYITAYASGIVASAAVPILAVCDKRIAAPGILLMLHEAAIWKWPGRETSSDIRSQNALMKLLQDNYVSYLVQYSKLSKEEWDQKITTTTWFSAQDALKWGLIDEIQ